MTDLKNKKEKKKDKGKNFPVYCDYSCKYASFGNPESTGACRKELSVWCNYFKRFNNKNNKCLA